MIRIRSLMAGVASLVWAAVVLAELPHAPVPGGIARIPLPASASQPAPLARFQNKPVLVMRDADAWHALVGLPLDIKPGTHVLQTDASPLSFEVGEKHYPEQRLRISDQRKVDPLPEDLRRIEHEQQVIRGALNHFSPEAPPDIFLPLPTTGPLSSPFGLRRYFNEQPRKPHSGLDIAAPLGTPVKAPMAGRVLAQGDFFFNGRTVLLDHGQGLVSLYCHLDRIDVQDGERLEVGQQIGTVGMSGRVTGPHLHWGVALNGNLIDPNLLLNIK
jgi:biotin carboxyl carrier protein